MASPQVPPPVYRRPRSLAGPVILILMGVVFLLITLGRLPMESFGLLFAHYWPVLLILAGVIKLAESFIARQSGTRSTGFGAGSIFLLIMIVVFGLIASQLARVDWQGIGDNIDVGDNNFPFFGHAYDREGDLAQAFPAGASLHVTNVRGAVNVTTSDDNQIKLTYHQRIRADGQKQADDRSAEAKPQISVNGQIVNVNVNPPGWDKWMTTDVDISIPRKASVVISTRRGDASVLGRDGTVDVTAKRGEVSVSDINGKVSLNLDHSSAHLSQISDDVTIEGNPDDVSADDVKGAVHMTGEFDSIKLSKIARTVSFKSARTDLEFAKLNGDLDMDSGDLRASDIVGPLRILTRSKDIHLTSVSGDVRLQNENGVVELHINKIGNAQVENRNGDIQVYVPEKSGFQVEARASGGGEVQTDFGSLKIENGNDQASANGSIGGGGPKLQLNSSHGTIEIRKGLTVAQSAPPTSPKTPKSPAAPNAPAVTEN